MKHQYYMYVGGLIGCAYFSARLVNRIQYAIVKVQLDK